MFRKGDRVQYSAVGRHVFLSKLTERRGTIFRNSHPNRERFAVLWDDRRTAEILHQSLIEKVPDAE